VVGQVDLVPQRLHTASIEESDRVVELALLRPDRADNDTRAAVAGLGSERLHHRPRRRAECRPAHEVLGWVAGNEELRIDHPARALRSLAALPARSPTTGLSWARATFSVSVIALVMTRD